MHRFDTTQQIWTSSTPPIRTRPQLSCLSLFLQASFAALIPVRELIAPAQIADFVRYLCFSEAAPLITGAAHLLDGGYTAQ